MSAVPVITSILGLIGQGVKGFLGIKQNQLETVSKSLQILQQLDMNDTEVRKAALSSIIADAQSESWLARSWRPITMLVFVGLTLARYFGYVPPNMGPEEVTWMHNMVEYGILGYGGSRSIEKIASTLNLGRLLSNMMGGK